MTKSINDFIKLVDDRKFIIVGNYINSTSKIELICPNKHFFKITPTHFKKGHGCSKCSGNCPEQAKNNFIKLVNERKFIIIGNYIDNSSEIELMCPNEHTFKITPSVFKSGFGCSKCSGKCPEQAKNNFIKLVNDRDFKIIGNYINSSTKIEMECPNAHVINVIPSYFKRSLVGCSKCVGTNTEQAKTNFTNLVSERGFKIIGDYINNSTKIELLCNNRHRINILPRNFTSGQGCVLCCTSGFNSTEKATFYIYELINPEGISAIGYGITNDFSKRNKTHIRTFKENNIKYKHLKSLDFDDGQKCLDFETIVKRLKFNINFNIDGFRRECLSIYGLETLNEMIMNLKK